MPYPPVIPPATRANTTAQLDNHPSDHNALSAALNAMPWGLVAMAQNTGAGQTGITTIVDVVGSALTFTRLATRRYQALMTITLQQVSAQATANVSIADAANTQLHNPGMTIPANLYMTLTSLWMIPAGSGPLSLKLRASTGGGSLSILNSALNPTVLAIYDIGPQ